MYDIHELLAILDQPYKGFTQDFGEAVDDIPRAAWYSQLAEECNELAIACHKMERWLRGENPPSPDLTQQDIEDMITEEFSDVMNVAAILGIEENYDIQVGKLERIVQRYNLKPKKNKKDPEKDTTKFCIDDVSFDPVKAEMLYSCKVSMDYIEEAKIKWLDDNATFIEAFYKIIEKEFQHRRIEVDNHIHYTFDDQDPSSWISATVHNPLVVQKDAKIDYNFFF